MWHSAAPPRSSSRRRPLSCAGGSHPCRAARRRRESGKAIRRRSAVVGRRAAPSRRGLRDAAPGREREESARPAARGTRRAAGGRADDLTKIKGLGPKSVEKLHGLGVYHFDQIAGWSSENVAWIGATLAVPGRPERGRWVAQAKDLAGAKSEAAAERAQAE